jgi:DNA-binding response OmpR family regulator
VPIIFLTASAQEKDALGHFPPGSVQFLSKPYDSKILLQRVRDALA